MNARDEPSDERSDVDAPRRGRPVSQEKQQAVLDAAIAEFAEVGFDSASMESIAARAGVAKRTLYNRFQSKDGLFDALVSELAHRIEVSSSIGYDPKAPLRDQLLAYARENQQLLGKAGNLQLLRAVLGEHIRRPERVEPLLHKYWITEYGLIDWMKSACADGKLSGDPTQLAHLMGSLLKSVILWPSLLGRGTPSDATARKMLATNIDMFLGHFQKRKP